jgi:hypothetical protein
VKQKALLNYFHSGAWPFPDGLVSTIASDHGKSVSKRVDGWNACQRIKKILLNEKIWKVGSIAYYSVD